MNSKVFTIIYFTVGISLFAINLFIYDFSDSEKNIICFTMLGISSIFNYISNSSKSGLSLGVSLGLCFGLLSNNLIVGLLLGVAVGLLLDKIHSKRNKF